MRVLKHHALITNVQFAARATAIYQLRRCSIDYAAIQETFHGGKRFCPFHGKERNATAEDTGLFRDSRGVRRAIRSTCF